MKKRLVLASSILILFSFASISHADDNGGTFCPPYKKECRPDVPPKPHKPVPEIDGASAGIAIALALGLGALGRERRRRRRGK